MKENRKVFIFGLGNYDKKDSFFGTRHNIGIEIIREIIFFYKLKKINSFSNNFSIWNSKIEDKKINLYVIEPHCLINNSGEVIKKAKEIFSIDNEDIIIVYDDIYIDLGEINFRLKRKNTGRGDGHNGMKDIFRYLNDNNIKRLKIGVGINPQNKDLSDWVISKFTRSENIKIDKIKQGIIPLLEDIFKGIIKNNLFNFKKKII